MLMTALIEDQRYEDAVNHANEMMLSHYGNSSFLLLAGISYRLTNRLEKSAHVLERALVLDPNSYDIHVLLAEIYTQINGVKDAVQ